MNSVKRDQLKTSACQCFSIVLLGLLGGILHRAEAETRLVAYLPVFDGSNAEEPVVENLQVWALDGPRLLKTIKIGRHITYVDVTNDGSTVYVARSENPSIISIDTATMMKTRIYPLSDSVAGMSLSPDEGSIYWAGGDKLYQLDLTDGSISRVAILFGSFSMSASKDRKALLLDGHDVDGFRFLAGLSVPDHSEIFVMRSPPSGSPQAISEDRRTLFLNASSYIRAIDIPTKQIIWARRINRTIEIAPGFFLAAFASEIWLSEDEIQLLIATRNSGILRMDIQSGDVSYLHPELRISEIDRQGNIIIALPPLEGIFCNFGPLLPPCSPFYEDTQSVVLDLETGEIVSQIPFSRGAAVGRGNFLGSRPALPIDTLTILGSLVLVLLIMALTRNTLQERRSPGYREVGGKGSSSPRHIV